MRTFRRPRRWWAWRGVQVLCLGALVGLAGLTLSPGHAAAPVTYELAWATDGVTVADDGSWTVATDTGAVVTVTGGSLATWSTTLLECPHGHSLLDRVRSVLGVDLAAAGHASGGPDAAEAVGPVTQALVDPSSVVLGDGELVEPDYCEAHTAVAATGASDRAVTLTVEGRWQAPGAEEAVPFTITSRQAWGAIVPADLGGDVRTVRVVRDLATMFDGVDPTTQSELDQARTVLANLTEHTTLTPG